MPITYAVRYVMTEDLVTTDVQDTARNALRRMAEKNIGSIVATEKGKPTGILTERDIIRKCCPEGRCQNV